MSRRAINAYKVDDETWEFAQDKLLQQWSLEQISGQADISPETVYQRVYADKKAVGSFENIDMFYKWKRRHSAPS